MGLIVVIDWRRRGHPTTREQVERRVVAEGMIANRANRVRANLAIATLILVLPFDAGIGPRSVAVGMIAILTGVSALVDRRASPEVAVASSWALSSVVVVVVVSAMPILWHAGLAVVVAISVGALSYGPRWSAALQALGAIGAMAVAGWLRDVDLWYLPILGIVAVAPPIERLHHERRAGRAESDRRYDTLVETAGLFFWELDVEADRLVSITGNTHRPLARHVDDVVATAWSDLLGDRRAFDQAIRALHRDGAEEGIDAVFELRDAAGRPVPFRHRMHLNPDTGFVQGAAVNISELTLATRLIRHHVEHDGLTGLITRNVFTDQLADRLAGCGPDDPVAVLIVDLHRFTEVNDVLGHRVGDRLLAILARRFERLDFAEAASRLGGDEFAFMLVGEHARHAVDRADLLVEVIEELVRVDRLTLSVSASVGIAIAPADGVSTEVLMMRADTAMYRAKNAGDRVVQFGDSHSARVGEHLALTAELQSAINEGQIEVWFQPQVDLATERVVGAEGLARWRHPDLGILTPDRFLPLLSVSGDYSAFTDEVIRQGVAFAAFTRSQQAPIQVAVNLNAMSFFDHGLADRVAGVLAEHGVPAEQLTLEITESDMLEDLSVHGPVFERLAALGVGLSIDDFGVGYSSLSRLRHLPVDELKVDRSFVLGMATEPEDLVIVKSIVDLAAVLGHCSVAEGVESAEAAQSLRDMGCHRAQGYYFGKPMPAAEFAERYPAHRGVRRSVQDLTGS